MISHLALLVWPEPAGQLPCSSCLPRFPAAGGMWWVPHAQSGREWLRGSCGSLGDGGAASQHRLYLPSLAADKIHVSSQGLTQMCEKGREMIGSQVIQTQIHWNKTLFMPLKGAEEQKTDEGNEAHAYISPLTVGFGLASLILEFKVTVYDGRFTQVVLTAPFTHRHRCTHPPPGFFGRSAPVSFWSLFS